MIQRILLSGLLLFPVGAFAAAPKGVTVDKGWFAMAPNNQVAGFFSIGNTSSQAHLVTGWRSPGCHAMHLEEADGGGKHHTNHGLTIPAEDRMTFAPGSYHLACEEPTPALRVGDSVPVTFSFRSGATLTAPFAVRKVSAQPSSRVQAGGVGTGGG